MFVLEYVCPEELTEDPRDGARMVPGPALSSALAQATLTAYDAKRLLGPIQLGASTGAMSAGLSAGPLVRALGAPAMALVQVGLLLLSLWPNAKIRRVEERLVSRLHRVVRHALQELAALGVHSL